MALWEPGTQILWRYGDVAVPHVAVPMTVVEDTPDRLVAWLAVGTRYRTWARADGLPQRGDPATLFTAPRVQAELVWGDNDLLRVYEKGRSWSVWLFFDHASGRFTGWYCNVEAPHVRDSFTTNSRDHVLDVEVDLDRTTSRKDEDELVLAVAQGRYTAEEAVAITAVADEIEAVVAAWSAPFSDGWETFRPDPAWAIPSLPQVQTNRCS